MRAGPLTNDQRTQEYYRLALKCHELSNRKKGCDHQCAKCTLNVHLYMKNVRDATLIKTSAGIDYQRQLAVQKMLRHHDNTQLFGPLLALLLVAAIIILPIRCVIHKVSAPRAATPEVTAVATPEVEQRILTVCNAIRQPGDRNNDGEIDCIDYALAFYEYYGKEARIIWIVFDVNIDSHLFVAVPNGYGRLIYIEPGKTSTYLNGVLMQTVWRSAFDLNKCKDVTYAYFEIKNGTYHWRWP